MDRKYYTVEETAEKLGVHPKTIRRYIYSGKLAAQKITGQWRVYEDAITNYLSSCGLPTKEASPSIDDHCVFMDGDYFDSNSNLQICTIIDYFVKAPNEVSPLATSIMEIVTDYASHEGKNRFNYVFDHNEKKARFILWGSAAFIEQVIALLKNYQELKKED